MPTTATPTTAVPSPVPSPQPTASFIEVVEIGTAMACIAHVPCLVSWRTSGAEADCNKVTLTVRLNDGPCDTKQCDWVLTEQAPNDATPSTNIVVEGDVDDGSLYELVAWCPGSNLELKHVQAFSLLTTPAPTPAPSPAPTPRPTPRPTRLPTPLPSQAPSQAPTPGPSQVPTPGPTPSPVPAKAEKMSFVDAAGGPAAMGGAGAALLILAGLFALYKRRKYQKQYAREQDEEAPFDVDSPRQTPRPPLMPPPPPPPSKPVPESNFAALLFDLHAIDVTLARRRSDAGSSPLDRASTGRFARRSNLVDDNDLEADFEEWDYADETMGDEAKERPLDTPSPRRNSVTSYVARRKGRLVEWRPDGSAFVKWSEGDRFAHALVRVLKLPPDQGKAPPTKGVRPGESMWVGSAQQGFDIPSVQLSDDLRAAVERADMWPFSQRLTAMRETLEKLRVPYATGRVELKVKRSDCYGGARKAFAKLAPKAWRMSWFLKFDGESGLDAGGLSRDFWRLCLAKAFDEANGLFRPSDAGNTTYDVVGVRGIKDKDERSRKLLEYRFVGRCLAKCLFDNHISLEASPNVKILKYLVGEPIIFDDLRLVDEELWTSLNQLRKMPAEDFQHLCLTFEVTRKTVSGTETVKLKKDGDRIPVSKGNVNEFIHLRLREAVYGCHRDALTALLAGFHELVPPAAMLLVTARELELALCGTPTLDLDEWKKHTVYKGAFANDRAEHPVTRAFWQVVERWDDERRARLLQWTTGSARLPVGGFAQLQQRDGVSRCFCLTSIPVSQATYPRAHTCFNRIDLPLYDRPANEMPRALEFVITNATAEFSMD